MFKLPPQSYSLIMLAAIKHYTVTSTILTKASLITIRMLGLDPVWQRLWPQFWNRKIKAGTNSFMTAFQVLALWRCAVAKAVTWQKWRRFIRVRIENVPLCLYALPSQRNKKNILVDDFKIRAFFWEGVKSFYPGQGRVKPSGNDRFRTLEGSIYLNMCMLHNFCRVAVVGSAIACF